MTTPFGRNLHSLSSNILKGISVLLHVYKDTLDDEVFKEKLGIVSIREIIRSAKERQSGSIGYSAAMLAYYMKGTRGGKNVLSINKLYDFMAERAKRYKKSARDIRKAESAETKPVPESDHDIIPEEDGISYE